MKARAPTRPLARSARARGDQEHDPNQEGCRDASTLDGRRSNPSSSCRSRHGLRKAFSTLSDVLVEEVDLIRSEAAERHDETQQKLEQQAKSLKAARTELALLRSETQTGRAALQTKCSTLEERLDLLQDDLTVLAQEVAKGGSAHHLLQLETVQLRSAIEEEVRERRAEHEAAAHKVVEMREKLEKFDADARASMQA